MIQTIEIPREDWPAFLKLFSRMTSERTIRIELESVELGVQPLAGPLVFDELTFERNGSEAGTLMLFATTDTGEFTHRIEGATRLHTGHNELGLLEWLAIGVADGQLLIHFEQPRQLIDHGPQPFAQA